MHCKPMQTPNKGIEGPNSTTVCNEIPESWGAPETKDRLLLGEKMTKVATFFNRRHLPGPGEISIPLGFFLKKPSHFKSSANKAKN